MKIEKYYLGICVLIIFLASLVSASAAIMTSPHPMGGNIYLGNQELKGAGIEVKIKDIQTGETITVTTDSGGFYLFDTGNFKISPFPLCYGHTLKITACTGDPECVQEIIVNDEGGQTDINFYLPATATVSWKGIAYTVMTLLVILSGVVIYKRRKGFAEKLLKEILQNAQNVAYGKLKDIASELKEKDIKFLIDYEQETKRRSKIIKYLISL